MYTCQGLEAFSKCSSHNPFKSPLCLGSINCSTFCTLTASVWTSILRVLLFCLLFREVVLNWGTILPRRSPLAMSAVIFGCHDCEVLLESHWRRPGMLLNILQCTGEPLRQRAVWTQMSSMLRLRNPALEWQCSLINASVSSTIYKITRNN